MLRGYFRTTVLLYRIGPSSNTATPSALFGGSLRIELHSSSICTNTAIMLKSICIQSTSCFLKSDALVVILDYRESKYPVLQIYWTVVALLGLESYPTDGHTTDDGETIAAYVWRGMKITYQRSILAGLQRLVHYLLIALY